MHASAALPTHRPRLLAGLDLETTGLDVRTDRIVEIAVVLVDAVGHVVAPSVVRTVAPGVPIPEEARAVHGISDGASRSGHSPGAALRTVAAMLHRLALHRVPVVAYNARFDWPLLHAEATRHGVTLPTGVILVDPLVVERHFSPASPDSRALTSTARRYGIVPHTPHTAEGDARTAVALWCAQLRRWPHLRHLPSSTLVRTQRAWASTHDPTAVPWPGLSALDASAQDPPEAVSASAS